MFISFLREGKQKIYHPKISPFGIWNVLSQRQSRSSRVKKDFYVSLNYLKEFRWGAYTEPGGRWASQGQAIADSSTVD